MEKLVIFDVDGTLCHPHTTDLLPGVADFIALARIARNAPVLAIATNQGGVGLRHWMEQGSFGEPGRYASEAEALATYGDLAQSLGARLYVAFAYQAKSGAWAPTPERPIAPECWAHDWRKPSPGMLIQAMADAGATPAETIFIGDSPEDQQAAAATGCYFQWAQKFFARGWEKGKDYDCFC